MRKAWVIIVISLILSACSSNNQFNNVNSPSPSPSIIPSSQITDIEGKIEKIWAELEQMRIQLDNSIIMPSSDKYDELHNKVSEIEIQLRDLVNDDNTEKMPDKIVATLTVINIDNEQRYVEVNLRINNTNGKYASDFIVDFYLGDGALGDGTLDIFMPTIVTFSTIEGDKPYVDMTYRLPYQNEDRIVARIYDKVSATVVQAEFLFSDVGDDKSPN